MEPVAGNMNMVKPIDGFLQAIRDVCDEYKSVFIIDESNDRFPCCIRRCSVSL
nr:hypothetical protein [Acinetobacter baumannii]